MAKEAQITHDGDSIHIDIDGCCLKDVQTYQVSKPDAAGPLVLELKMLVTGYASDTVNLRGGTHSKIWFAGERAVQVTQE